MTDQTTNVANTPEGIRLSVLNYTITVKARIVFLLIAAAAMAWHFVIRPVLDYRLSLLGIKVPPPDGSWGVADVVSMVMMPFIGGAIDKLPTGQ